MDQLHCKTGNVIIKKLKDILPHMEYLMNYWVAMNHLLTLQNFELFAIIWDWACNQLPGYPKSNGWVENAFKTAKSLIKKAKASGANYFLSLLSWRKTPTEGLSTLPAQHMFGQRTRTHLQGPLAIAERGDSQSTCNATSTWQEPDMVQSRNRRTSRCAIQ